MASAQIPATTAREPFNDVNNADVILRTSDNVYFYLNRCVLKLSGPFFESLFSLPQPPSALVETPVIDVTEDSAILDKLLGCFYVAYRPAPQSFKELIEILKVAEKYEVQCATDRMLERYCELAARDPLRAWAIATHEGQEDAALAAAAELASANPLGKPGMWIWNLYDPAVDDVSAGAYRRLLRCLKLGVLDEFCMAEPAPPVVLPDVSIPPLGLPLSEFADIIVRSSDGDELAFCAEVLAKFSPVLAEMISLAKDSTERVHGLPVIRLNEPSPIFWYLFYSCQNCVDGTAPRPKFSNLNYRQALMILKAARRYQLQQPIRAIRERWISLAHNQLLGAYLIAAQCGWAYEARQISYTFVVEAIMRGKVYGMWTCPEMEDVSARHYNRLHKLAETALVAVREKESSILHSARGDHDAYLRMMRQAVKEVRARVSFDFLTPVSPVGLVLSLPLKMPKPDKIGRNSYENSQQDQARLHR